MEPDLAPSGSAICKFMIKTIGFDAEKISKKVTSARFYSQMPIYFFQKRGIINKL